MLDDLKAGSVRRRIIRHLCSSGIVGVGVGVGVGIEVAAGRCMRKAWTHAGDSRHIPRVEVGVEIQVVNDEGDGGMVVG